MTTTEFVPVAEQAKLVRKALAKAFPETKFYVRSKSYSGGASIDVYYDGTERVERDEFTGRYVRHYKEGAPTTEAVDRVVQPFAGGGFDGMIDLAYDTDTYLDADGAVVGHSTYGTEGSRGTVPASSVVPAGPARRVGFHAKYLFVEAELPYDVRTKGA